LRDCQQVRAGPWERRAGPWALPTNSPLVSKAPPPGPSRWTARSLALPAPAGRSGRARRCCRAFRCPWELCCHFLPDARPVGGPQGPPALAPASFWGLRKGFACGPQATDSRLAQTPSDFRLAQTPFGGVRKQMQALSGPPPGDLWLGALSAPWWTDGLKADRARLRHRILRKVPSRQCAVRELPEDFRASPSPKTFGPKLDGDLPHFGQALQASGPRLRGR